MIKLERSSTPIALTPAFVKAQTAIFKISQTNVWNLEWLKECLLDLSNGKCAYCECNLREESKYMEVEHFEDKDTYPDKVLEWSNLLPSCKRCNGAKSTHNVITHPIVNPFVDPPSNHLYLDLYRIRYKDIKGKTTIDILGLNHPERAVRKRFDVGQGLEKLIEITEDRLDMYENNSSTRHKNRLLIIVEELLNECQPKAIYSATCATILHSNPVYQDIKKRMGTLGLWTSNFADLDLTSRSIIL